MKDPFKTIQRASIRNYKLGNERIALDISFGA